MLCSMIRMLPPAPQQPFERVQQLRDVVEMQPVVGSSKIYSVPSLVDCARCAASFTRCASPPESVVADCPSRRYPSPTSFSTFNFCTSLGVAEKNAIASFTVSCSTS